MKTIGLIFLLWSWQAPDEEASDLYDQGRFAEALARLEARDDLDLSAQELGLMGRCAYGAGLYPLAVLHWRRAAMRDPGDPDIAHNLQMALDRLGIQEAAPATPFHALIRALRGLSVRRLLGLLVALQMFGLISWWVARHRTSVWAFRLRMAGLAALAAGMLLAVFLIHARYFEDESVVVIVARAPLLSEPDSLAPAFIELFGGETLRVIDAGEDWLQVRHQLGDGWLPRSAVGFVHQR